MDPNARSMFRRWSFLFEGVVERTALVCVPSDGVAHCPVAWRYALAVYESFCVDSWSMWLVVAERFLLLLVERKIVAKSHNPARGGAMHAPAVIVL